MLDVNKSSMVYKTLRMDLVNKITELHAEGVPKKRIARILGLSKNTVKKYLDKSSRSGRDDETGGADLDNQADTSTREAALNALLPQINRELGRHGVPR
jgi:predicted transcriptional regulator